MTEVLSRIARGTTGSEISLVSTNQSTAGKAGRCRREQTGDVRPANGFDARHETELRIFVEKRMAPILKLDDIRLEGQRANSHGIALDDDAAPAARDNVRVPAVDRRFEKHESLIDTAR